MSEMQTEQAPPRGGVLTRRVGPLALWVWLVIITAAGLGYYLWKGKSSSTAAGADTSGTGSETSSSDVPDYVSQTTINLTEPAEPEQPGSPGNTGTPPPPPPPKGTKPPVKKPTAPGKKQPPVKKPATTTGKQPPIFSNSYTVKAGDTLDKLAAKFKVTRVELAHANGLGTGAGLRTGQILKVPGPLKPRSQGGPG
jgi:LysM repeat protein